MEEERARQEAEAKKNESKPATEAPSVVPRDVEMMDNMDDDLAQAIAMSMEKGSNPPVIETADTEMKDADAEIEAALKLSVQPPKPEVTFPTPSLSF
jgi:hypothetical protein